jgi:hypothetical protein
MPMMGKRPFVLRAMQLATKISRLPLTHVQRAEGLRLVKARCGSFSSPVWPSAGTNRKGVVGNSGKQGTKNLVYIINEPAAFGAYTVLNAAGKEKNALIVSVDGGCVGIRHHLHLP